MSEGLTLGKVSLEIGVGKEYGQLLFRNPATGNIQASYLLRNRDDVGKMIELLLIGSRRLKGGEGNAEKQETP